MAPIPDVSALCTIPRGWRPKRFHAAKQRRPGQNCAGSAMFLQEQTLRVNLHNLANISVERRTVDARTRGNLSAQTAGNNHDRGMAMQMHQPADRQEFVSDVYRDRSIAIFHRHGRWHVYLDHVLQSKVVFATAEHAIAWLMARVDQGIPARLH
jgi:hypothetical protein